MKKILLFLIFICLSMVMIAQTGVGWGQQRSKVNFKDSINIAKGWMINGIVVLPSVAEINYIDGVSSAIQSQINGKLSISDTAAMLSNYPIKPEVSGEINDTIVARLAAAAIGVAVVDSTDGSSGNNYYATPNYVESYVGTGGSGTFTGDILRYIIGTTTGAPTTADSTIIHTSFIGKHIDLYRDGALAYWNINASANTTEGFRKRNPSDTIYVNPLWQDEEKIEIRIRNPNTWNYLSLSGEESSLLDSLMLYYKLDEASGTLADDANDIQDGTLYGGAPRVVGKLGNAVHIIDVGDAITSPYNAATKIDTTFSISMWFYLDSLPSVAGEGYLFYAKLDVSPWYAAAIALESTDRLRFTVRKHISPYTAYNVYSPATLQDSTWYNLVVTCRGNGLTSQLYLNGTDVSTGAGAFSGGIYNSTGNLNFGNMYTGAMYSCPNRVDEIGLWNRVLTVGEVTILYSTNNGKTHPFTE